MLSVLRLLLEYKDKIKISDIHYERYDDILVVYLQFENPNQAQLSEQILEEIIQRFKGDANE